MKPTFLKTLVRNFCLVLTLAASLLSFSALPASAQTNYSSEEINNAILMPGSIRPEWIQPNDGNPWQITDGKLYPYRYNDLSFRYRSSKPTMIEIGAYEYSSNVSYPDQYGFDLRSGSSVILSAYGLRNGSYESYYGTTNSGNKRIIRMPAGEYILSFRQKNQNSSYYNNPSNYHIYSFGIFEIDENADMKSILTAKSKPIEIINDPTTPWYNGGNGVWKTSFTDQKDHNVPLKFRFTTDKICKLSWESCLQMKNTWVPYLNNDGRYNAGYYSNLHMTEDGDSLFLLPQTTVEKSWTTNSAVFMPGTHEVTLYGYQETNTSYTSNKHGFLQPMLRNVELTDEWFDVASTPGDLGNCVIDEIAKVNYTSLRDVELLKVRGKMDASDWATITQMSNIKALDLSEAEFTTLPAKQFRGNLKLGYISLPRSMETVGMSAFKGSRLRYANLQDGTKLIGDSAFYGTYIRNMIIPSTVTELGLYSFYDTYLKEVSFPASLEKIGNYAFASTSLQNVSFPANSRLKHLGSYAFNSCAALESVELPDSLTSFGTNSQQYLCWDTDTDSQGNPRGWYLVSDYNYSYYNYSYYSTLYYSGAFAWCPKLRSIKFPANLEYIPDGICLKSTGLETVVFPKRLKTVGVASFICTSFNEITLPDSVTTINTCAFADATGDKECKLTLPESIRVIKNHAFYKGNISETNFPEGLQTIESNAFDSNKFTDVKLPLKLSDLGSNAFLNNSRMKRFQLHSGAQRLSSVVDSCSALGTIVLPCATPPTLATNEDFVGSLDKKKINLVVPDFALSSYRLDPYWYTFGAINSGVEATDQLYWNVTGNLRLREGKRMIGTPDVDVASGSSMTVIGNTPASFGKVTLMNEPHYYGSSSSTYKYVNSYSRFITESPATTVGTFEARCKVYPGQWYMLTPLYDVNLADVKVEGITATSKPNYVFRYYDASSRAAGYNNATASSNWRNVSTPTLKAGQGYIFQTDAEGTIIFPEVDGSTAGHLLSTTAAEIPLREMPSNTTANAHWNFIGNPYAAYFDVWYLDLEAPITVYEKSNTGAITYKAISLTDDKRLLAPMEPFFVQKPDTASVARFDIEGRRPTATYGEHQGQRVKRQRRDDVNRKLFNVELLDKDGQSIDQTRVVINEKAMLDYEIACDASKFMAETGAQIYTIDPERTRMAINERPLADGIVPLGIRTGDERSCTIAATRADGNVWLRDELTGDEIDITTSPYVVNCKANTSIEGRFSLRFAPVQTGIIDPAQKARVEAGAGYIAVENPAEAEVAVYNASGIEAMHSSEKSIRHELPAGIYMVRIGADTHKLIVK